MAKASDNLFPSLLFKETAAPASPAAGNQRLFVDPSDHLLKYKNSAGVVSGVGGAGGSTIKYPPLKPATPTDDFAAATLNGAWSAHTSGGAFATTDCITQARDGSNLRMMYTDKMGCLWRTQANTDLDLRVGGLRASGQFDGATGSMFGIAALDSSGGGVGVTVYNDGNMQLATITGWAYASYLQVFAGVPGHNLNPAAEYWLRLVRVTNTWTMYYSFGGDAWGTVSASGAGTFTIDRIAIGAFYNTGNTYKGSIEADWIDVT